MFSFMLICRVSPVCFAISGSLLLIPTVAHAGYIFTDVKNPSDPVFTQLLGINNAGTIAGFYGDGANVPNNGFRLVLPNTFTPENFPGSAQTQVVGINNAGDTVGFYIDNAGATHGFSRANGGVFSTKDAPGTAFNQLLGLNDSGESAGYSSTDFFGLTAQRAFTLSGGAFSYLDALGIFPVGTSNDLATDVNNAGVVSGFYTTPTATVGFLLKGSTLTAINYPAQCSLKRSA